MSTLSNSNVSADGIRDLMEDLSSNGGGDSVPINGDYISDRFALINGSANTSNSTSDTATKQFNDASRSIGYNAGTATWTTGSGKSSVSHSFVGWGTSGGVQGATNNGSTSQVGTLYDGSSSYTSSAIPVTNIDSGFESNKWLSAAGYTGSLSTGFFAVLAFEGSSAGTGDSDWSNVYFKVDGTGTLSGVDYNPGVAGISYARSGATITTQYSRIVYKWSIGIVDLTRVSWNASLLSGVEQNTFFSIR